MKQAVTRTLALLGAVSLLTVPSAASAAPKIGLTINGIHQAYDVSPYVKNDRTLVPLRGIFQDLGATVSWDEATQTVTAAKDGTSIVLRVGAATATINGKEAALDQPVELLNNRTMVPLRFVSEALGAEVRWDEESQLVRIYSKEKKETVLHLSLDNNPTSLDPAAATDSSALTLLEQTGEGLIRLDRNGYPVPGVAKAWDISADGTVYTFHLHPNAKWSDGTPVTAHDFEYAWKRVLNPQARSQYAFLFSGIKNASDYNAGKANAEDVAVAAKDDHTLQVTLSAPQAYFLRLAAFPTFFPVKQSVVETGGEDFGVKWSANVYNGPFKPDVWNLGKSVGLVKNGNYWDSGNVKLQSVDYVFETDAAREQALFKNGLIDVYTPAKDTLPVSPDSSTVVTKPPTGQVWYLQYNQKTPVLQNAKIRQALTYAVDGQAYALATQNSFAHEATGFVPTGISDGFGSPFRDKAGDVLKNDQNAAKAKQLLQEGLKECGLPEFPKLTLLTKDLAVDKTGSQLIIGYWRDMLGIDVDVKNEPYKLFLNDTYQRKFDIALSGWMADYDDPETFLDMWVTGGAFNSEGYSNAQYDQLIQQARQETDFHKRTDLLISAEKLLLRDMAVGPIYFTNSVQVAQSYVKNIVPRATGPLYDLKDAYIEGKN